MTENQEALFRNVFVELADAYPNRNLELKWDYDRWVVSVDGEVKFTTLGWNFLYNLTRLCKCLNDELL